MAKRTPHPRPKITIIKDGTTESILRNGALEGTVTQRDPKTWTWESVHAIGPMKKGVASSRGEAFAQLGYKFTDKARRGNRAKE